MRFLTFPTLFALPLLLVLTAHAWAEDRALLIGINDYPNLPPDKQLQGSLNDVTMMREMATQKLGYSDAQMKVLINEDATKANILATLNEWVLQGTQVGDRALVYYSGHGAYTKDLNNDEQDGMDETLAPYDTSTNGKGQYQGMLLDDELDRLLTTLEEKKVDTLLIVDSCHSGTNTRALTANSRGIANKSLMASGSATAANRNLTLFTSQEEKEGSFIHSSAHRTVWSAATDRQLAFEEHTPKPAGVFTRLLHEAVIEGKASTNGDALTNKALFEYLRHHSQLFCSSHDECATSQKYLTPVLNMDTTHLLSTFSGQNGITAPPSTNSMLNSTFPQTRNTGIDLSIRESTTLTLGQAMRVEVKNNTDKPGKLLLLDKRADGQLVQLFPNKYWKQDRIGAGETLYVPRNPSWGFQIKAVEVGNAELVAVIAGEDVDFTRLAGQPKDLELEPVTDNQQYLSSLAGLLQEIVTDGEFSQTRPYQATRLGYQVVGH